MSDSEFRWRTINSADELESFYKEIIPKIREAAKTVGYAIGVHGSMRRDLDLIAMPWSDVVCNKDELATAIQEAACGLSSKSYQWEEKPNGRFATCMPICFPDFSHGTKSLGHIDLSIMEVK